jgi:DNA-binding CsgD family transcriptional regulator
MKVKQVTYRNFLDSVKFHQTAQLKEQSTYLINHFRPAQQAFYFSNPAFFLLDYSTKEYIYVEANFLNQMGYTDQFFLETGLETYLSKWHQHDFEIINARVFPDNIAFLKTLPLEDYPLYIFSYNYRMRDTNGDYFTTLQRFSYIPSTVMGEPAGMIGIVLDITHFKNDLSVIHTIEKVLPTTERNITELILKKSYPIYEVADHVTLTKREREILSLIAEGLSSKQIAPRINVSINTINNHRKNMLAKTACSSASELMHYAVKHGLI